MAKGHENLIDIRNRPTEEQREIQRKGGEANKARWEKIREFRDIVKSVIGDTIKDKEGKEVPISVAMTLAQVKKALKGDTKAFKVIADVVCEKQQKVDVTSSDGSMMPLDIKIKVIDTKQVDE